MVTKVTHALQLAERFIEGFEDDETQDGVGLILDAIRGAKLQRAQELRAQANEARMAEPGHGTPAYRGDPYQAVAWDQEADALDPPAVWPCPYCDGANEHAPSCEMLAIVDVEQAQGFGVFCTIDKGPLTIRCTRPYPRTGNHQDPFNHPTRQEALEQARELAGRFPQNSYSVRP